MSTEPTTEAGTWVPDRCGYCGHVLSTGELVYASPDGIEWRLDAAEQRLNEAREQGAREERERLLASWNGDFRKRIANLMGGAREDIRSLIGEWLLAEPPADEPTDAT